MPQGFIIEKTFYTLSSLTKDSLEDRSAKKASRHLLIRFSLGFGLSLFLLGVGVLIWQIMYQGDLEIAEFIRPSYALLSTCFGLLVTCFGFMITVDQSRQSIRIPKRQHADDFPEITTIHEDKIQTQDISSFLTDDARKSLEMAFQLAERFEHAEIEPIHLFLGTIDDVSATIFLSRLGIDFETIKDALSRRLSQLQTGDTVMVGDVANSVLLFAFRNAYWEGRSEISSLELLAEAFLHDGFLQELFESKEVTREQAENMIAWIRIHEQMQEQYAHFQKAAGKKPTGPMNRAMTSVATPLLDAYSIDLTTAAVQGQLPLLVGREEILEEVFQIIEGGRESVVLVGPSGVGKQSILGGLASLMVEERVPDVLKDKRLVQISLPHLVGGVSAEESQDRFLTMLNEVAKSRNIILAFTDLDQLPPHLAPLLYDYLSRGATFSIATATPQAYQAELEASVLSRTFQKIVVAEPETDLAIRILESKIGAIEHQSNVQFLYAGVEACILLSDRYMHEAYLPKKAIDVAKEVAQAVSGANNANKWVGAQDVAKRIASKTGVPVANVAEDERMKLLHLEETMHGRVIGQDEAVKSVASALRRARADMRPGSRPIASFLFLGSTGVGKTELAKTLAATYFGSEEMMIRLDMSEYQDTRSLDRLMGTPGSGQGGIFSEAVRARPFSIVLLDELEKAEPNVLNVFLQVLEDGRLTDAAGRTVDFTNTIIIATSNAGSAYIQEAIKNQESMESIKTHMLEEELRMVYRPEFLNRFDGVIIFKPLEQDQITQIAKLMIATVAKRLEAKGIGFQVTEAALDELAKKGYDPKYGARPLRRVIQETVDDAIANALLEGTAQRRDTLILDTGGKLTIQKGKEL